MDMTLHHLDLIEITRIKCRDWENSNEKIRYNAKDKTK